MLPKEPFPARRRVMNNIVGDIVIFYREIIGKRLEMPSKIWYIY